LRQKNSTNFGDKIFNNVLDASHYLYTAKGNIHYSIPSTMESSAKLKEGKTGHSENLLAVN